jgi:hypothetical protein
MEHHNDVVPPNAGNGFIAWYVLQYHRTNHHPFVTKIVIEMHSTVSGIF